MSETAKRKGPLTKAELITRAVENGIVSKASELENLSVKGIRLFIEEAKAKQPEFVAVSVKARTEALTKADELGIGTAEQLKEFTVGEIQFFIREKEAALRVNGEPEPTGSMEYLNKIEDDTITEKEPGPEEPAMEMPETPEEKKSGARKKSSIAPSGTPCIISVTTEINEPVEPNCGHIFRKVLEIHKGGNIHVNICNICGWRETVK